MSPDLYVQKVVALVHTLQRHHHVVGVAGVGIEGDKLHIQPILKSGLISWPRRTTRALATIS